MSSIPHNARLRYRFNRRSLRAFVVKLAPLGEVISGSGATVKAR